MAGKRGRKQDTEELAPLDDGGSLFIPATEMEIGEFATEFRRRAQGSLWLRVDKVTIGDLVRLKEIEQENERKTDPREPKELRVIWIEKRSEPLM
jgi:hypothetical protein